MAPIVTDALEVTGSAAGRGLGASALATSLAVHAAGVALLLLLVSAPTSAPQPLPIQVIPVAVLQGGALGEPASGAEGDAAADAAGPAPMPIEDPVREAAPANDASAPPAPAEIPPAERVEAVPPASDEAAPPVPVAATWTPPKPPRKAPKRAPSPSPAAVVLETTLATLKPAPPSRSLRALPVSLRQGGTSTGGGGSLSGATGSSGNGGDQRASLTPARFSGQGLSNPAPRYPMAARRRGQEGRVLLRVLVTPAGQAGSVSLLRTSGHRLLDKAAMAAVEDWRFVPARQGGAAIESMIDVPIAFKLTD